MHALTTEGLFMPDSIIITKGLITLSNKELMEVEDVLICLPNCIRGNHGPLATPANNLRVTREPAAQEKHPTL